MWLIVRVNWSSSFHMVVVDCSGRLIQRKVVVTIKSLHLHGMLWTSSRPLSLSKILVLPPLSIHYNKPRNNLRNNVCQKRQRQIGKEARALHHPRRVRICHVAAIMPVPCLLILLRHQCGVVAEETAAAWSVLAGSDGVDGVV